MPLLAEGGGQSHHQIPQCAEGSWPHASGDGASMAGKKGVCVGVLALQGAFYEHIEFLTRIGVKAIAIRNPEDMVRAGAAAAPLSTGLTLLRDVCRKRSTGLSSRGARARPFR